MQLQGEKDSGKNNENSTVAILNIDTDLLVRWLLRSYYQIQSP